MKWRDNDPRPTAMAPGSYVDKEWPGAMIAKYSSTCPNCGHYIQKNQSPIKRLPAGGLAGVEWVHAHCYDDAMKLLYKITTGDQSSIF